MFFVMVLFYWCTKTYRSLFINVHIQIYKINFVHKTSMTVSNRIQVAEIEQEKV